MEMIDYLKKSNRHFKYNQLEIRLRHQKESSSKFIKEERNSSFIFFCNERYKVSHIFKEYLLKINNSIY